MNIFQKLTVGDSAHWSDDAYVLLPAGDRLTSAAWTLKYEFRGPAVLSLTAVADGDGWVTTLSTADSAALVPGTYVWGAYLSKTGERLTIGGGTVVLAADPASLTGASEVRTVARKALDDCEAALANFSATGGKVKRYTIGSRETEFQTLADLMSLLKYWKLRVANEEAAQSVANGHGNPRKLLVRF